MYLYKLCVNELEELDFKKERGGSNQSGVWHQIERTFHFLPFAKLQNNVTIPIHTLKYWYINENIQYFSANLAKVPVFNSR